MVKRHAIALSDFFLQSGPGRLAGRRLLCLLFAQRGSALSVGTF